MTADRKNELVARALEARARAYAPYSCYQVGAAVLGDDGVIYQGANVENASYGLAMCAERSAVAAAVMGGARQIEAAAVATVSSPPAAPCGMCLQTLNEFAGDPGKLLILLVNPETERRELTLADCLPHGFRRDQLIG
jgi:cytidine deaminase